MSFGCFVISDRTARTNASEFHRPTQLTLDRRKLLLHQILHRRIRLDRHRGLRQVTHFFSFGLTVRITLNDAPCFV